MAGPRNYKNMFNWTVLSDYDNAETLSVCLTQREVMILKSALIPAYWRTRWIGMSGSLLDALDEMIAKIDSQLDGNDCEIGDEMEFRDNPQDLCEVQYSNDGGETWVTMFRKDVCPPDAATTIINIENIYIDIDTVTTNNTNYAGDIINVAPDWAYAGVSSDNALCYVVYKFIRFVCDAAVKQIETGNRERRESNNWLDDIAILISELVLDVALATSGLGTLPALLIGAVTWASVQFVEFVWDTLMTYGTDNYTDTDAQDVVACWMFNKMKGATPTFDKWSTSLDDFDHANPHEQAVATTVSVFNKNLDFYINFMVLMEDVNSVSELLPACPCPERWEHKWDFVTHGLENWVVGGPYGDFVEGVGVVAADRELTGWHSMILENLGLHEDIFRCDGFEFEMIAERGLWDANLDCLWMQNPPSGDWERGQGDFYTGTYSWRHNFTLNTLEFAKITYLRSCYTEETFGWGGVTVISVTLHGIGIDPFLGRETS